MAAPGSRGPSPTEIKQSIGKWGWSILSLNKSAAFKNIALSAGIDKEIALVYADGEAV